MGAARSARHPRTQSPKTSEFAAGVREMGGERGGMRHIRRPVLFGLPLVLVAGILTGSSVAAPPHASPLVIKTLSVRADLVSGGHVLTEVVLPRGVRASSVRVTLNGRN